MRRKQRQEAPDKIAPQPQPPARAKIPRLRRASHHAPLRGWRSHRQSRDENPDVAANSRNRRPACCRCSATCRSAAPRIRRGRSRRGGRFHVPGIIGCRTDSRRSGLSKESNAPAISRPVRNSIQMTFAVLQVKLSGKSLEFIGT